MELKILNTTKQETGKIKLPTQFEEEIRPDLIKRAVEAINSHNRQPYGADPRAGKKASAKLSRRRRKYRGGYGKGISRVPRKILSRNGSQMNWVGAFAPGTVGGRRAHPPTANKIWYQKINEKERKKALRSAITATVIKQIVEQRGHKTPQNYPFILSSDFEKITKAKEAKKALENLGLQEELTRTSQTHIRAGKGKMRGRATKRKIGPLIVVSQKCELLKAARNIPGVTICNVKSMNTRDLAPGAAPGRLTLYTEPAIQTLTKEKLYL